MTDIDMIVKDWDRQNVRDAFTRSMRDKPFTQQPIAFTEVRPRLYRGKTKHVAV